MKINFTLIESKVPDINRISLMVEFWFVFNSPSSVPERLREDFKVNLSCPKPRSGKFTN